MYFLGYDVGSSSIKAALVNAKTHEAVHVVKYPDHEMPIDSPQKGWAEQNPEDWWKNLQMATKQLLSEAGVDGKEVQSIGIAYQMHGLVLVDEKMEVLRPAIIWCDSRATASADGAVSMLGEEYCLSHLLNLPGNFTASKLKWVEANEPEIYKRIHKFMLPGDFIAMKMTDRMNTTIGGLSEGVFWDFESNRFSTELMNSLGLPDRLVPTVVDTIGHQGTLSESASKILGLKAGTPISYRAGDQPNNAMSLNVLKAGEVAATAGTSGVIYGVTNEAIHDIKSRVNGFAHVNHTIDHASIGILLCINGTGIQYSWVRRMLDTTEKSYETIEQEAAQIPVGSDGLICLPFGNGAERIFENKEIGSHLMGIDFNRHNKAHIYRATLEGIAFAFAYGANLMKQMGMEIRTMKVGNDNLFQSSIFSETLATTLDCTIEVFDTTGAAGAAKASGVGAGHLAELKEAMGKQDKIKTIEPAEHSGTYEKAYDLWVKKLETQLK
ncbi:carbohydrate kinase [Roseivirga sp. 4D4]|uniref:xylulokinase n=1 Tax=Roseivirga sp. 4D4 TaxID=1889784 RepID=UPI0008533661|nr:FGGY family carbohydrate kinase [Roseivirga sp. 4D4]OEK03008.1 carbohydrate kinase [Roseivirga sp. 4D4]